MKRVLTLAVGAIGLTANTASAQLPVSTAAQNRKVVLEEFTGIHCVYCPDGHKRANDIKASKPAGAVILSNIHTGSFATPSSGEPDYRTAEGNAIAAIPTMAITGYPTGSINRHIFAGKTGITINRGEWAKYADSILAMPSYVNVALQGSLNVVTRVMTVNVEAYYTANSPVSTNNLTVMLMEDNVAGPQTGAVNFYPSQILVEGSYTHNHLLRKVLNTAATGEVITTTTQGTTVTRTYTYTVPTQYVNNTPYLGNLRVAAFMAQGNTEIMTGAYGPVTLSGFTASDDGGLLSGIISESEICAGKLTAIAKLYNNGSSTITSATISMNANGTGAATATYTGSIAPATYKFVSLPTYNFTPLPTNTFNLTVATVNGSADANAANNTTSKSNINLTTRTAAATTAVMNFTQDQYGTESTWKVVNEVTGATVAQGGPYTNLAASGVLLHSTTFGLVPNTCYRVIVEDAFGDGMNSGTGAGGYQVMSNGVVVYTSNGVFTTKQESTFKSNTTLLGIADVVAGAAVRFSPNPARETATLEFTLNSSNTVRVDVVDMAGRTVLAGTDLKLAAGAQKATINTAALPAGIYMVRLQTEQGAVVERFSVVK